MGQHSGFCKGAQHFGRFPQPPLRRGAVELHNFLAGAAAGILDGSKGGNAIGCFICAQQPNFKFCIGKAKAKGIKHLFRCKRFKIAVADVNIFGIAKVQHSRIDSAGIEKYFDGMFISEEIGGRKPEPEYFQRCFERIPDFCKTHTAILGDSLSADMQGGKNAGITTIWFNRDDMPDEEGVRPDYEIRSLSELPALLKRI